jgi:hypothetical protein
VRQACRACSAGRSSEGVVQTAQFVCGHTIGPLRGIGKAVGRRAGCGCVLEIYSEQSGGKTEGPKGMWAMERSVSTPPDRHSTTRAVPSPPAPERSEIWLFEWAWGELCVELSVTATGELGAVVCWSCSAEKDCLRCTSGCCHAACRYCQQLPVAKRRLSTACARGVLTARQHLLFAPGTSVVEPRRGGGTGIGCSGSRVACGVRGLARVAPTQPS